MSSDRRPSLPGALSLRLGLWYAALFGGGALALIATTYALLEYLMRNPGRVVSKAMILSHVFDYSFDPRTNVVDVLVHRLRERVDKEFATPMIHTVRGMGYVLRPA